MSGSRSGELDFDRLAEVIGPDDLARAIGTKKGRGQDYHCPNTAGHSDGDRKPSLSISRKDARTVAYCHGCRLSGSPVQFAADLWGVALPEAAEQLADKLGLSWPMAPPPTPPERSRIAATYDYTNEERQLLFQTVRYDPKDFRQRRPDGNGGWLWNLDGTRRVLFRLPEILDAIARGQTVYIVEGEKDVLAIEDAGSTATTCPMGAGKWRPEYTEALRGARVRIIADRDDAGRKHAKEVFNALRGIAGKAEILEARRGKDAADHLAAGYGLDDFVSMGELEKDAADSEGDRPPFILLSTLRERPELHDPPAIVIPPMGYRGRASLFTAIEKGGKSTYLAQVAADKSRGQRHLGQPITPGNVIWCGVEEALGDVVRRFEKMDADPNRIQLYAYEPADLFKGLRDLLGSWRPDLLVIDSLYQFARLVRGRAPESGDAAGWGEVVRPIVDLCREFDVANVTSHHARRSDGGYRDSSEIGAAFDAIFEMRQPKTGEDPCVRRVEGRGRWPIDPFDMVLRDGRYELAHGVDLSLEALLLIEIERNPGQGLNALAKKLKKNKQTVLETLRRLEERGVIENHRSSRCSAYFLASKQVSAGVLK